METLSWAGVERFLKSQTPFLLSLGGTRGARIGFDATPGGHLYIRLPVPPGTEVPPEHFSEFSVKIGKDDTGTVLQLSTASDHFYREFHRFAGLLTEDFEQPEQTALGAFDAAIGRWKQFAAPKDILTPDQQLGLSGELMFLRALIRQRGPSAIDAWTGRDQSIADRHDFRIGVFDVEVKSTRTAHRRHMIHGLHQLTPSKGHSLFILSLRLADAGSDGGLSLKERVAGIRQSITGANTARAKFEEKLASAEYDDDDDEHYGNRLILADSPMIVPVDERCPRVTLNMLESVMPSAVAGRIDQMSYRVDLEGLGEPEGGQTYKRTLGDLTLE